MRESIRGTTRELDEAARAMRRRPTDAEAALWAALQKRQVAGLRFRRQHPIGRFVLDFYCASCRLAIEVDGGVHDLQPERDIERTRVLETHGIRVIRFRNAEVLTDLPRVVASITQAIVRHHAELASSQPPPGVLGEVRA